jgi:hypothetical protein
MEQLKIDDLNKYDSNNILILGKGRSGKTRMVDHLITHLDVEHVYSFSRDYTRDGEIVLNEFPEVHRQTPVIEDFEKLICCVIWFIHRIMRLLYVIIDKKSIMVMMLSRSSVKC